METPPRIACLAIAAVASCDFWAGRYCYLHRAKTSPPQTSTAHFQSGNVTISEMWLAARH